jgi:hypothetical protein
MATPLLFGPYGSAALPHAARFADLGANACWFHMFDLAAFEVCARHGIAACVEFKTFRADFAEHPELTPIGADGRPIRYGALVQGVCLSQRWFLEQIEQQLVAGVRAFAPAGIWLDYLTYAGWFEQPDPDLQESCFCRECIAEFCQATGIDAPTPAEILGQHAAAWTRHKCERVAAFGMRYAAIIRQHHPACVVGAYMCPWLPEEFGGALTRIFAQDYGLLTPAIDVFTPLIYGVKSGRPASWGREFLERAEDVVPAERRVQLILDALDGPESLRETSRSARPSWGLQLFSGAQLFNDRPLSQAFSAAVTAIRASAL